MSQLLAERHSSNALHISASIEPTNDFQHQPLDTTKQEVRLVKLHRAAADEHTHVFCDVRTFEIATAPPYVALSYTWGPPEPKRVIFIGDKSYEVRENLYNFLYAFRSEESNTEYIYIDQLCIDQGSPDERNHQVRLMAPIYTQCTFVIVWLDETSANAVSGFAATLHPDYAEVILRNRYFTRLWIVQEVLLPPEVRVLCNNIWLSWNALGDLIWKMPNWYLSIYRAHDTASMAWLFGSARRKLWDGQDRLPLERCVDLFACMECEDPRDKVYGLLGLASGEEHPEVDYRKTVHEVFLDTITALRRAHWKRCLETGKGHDGFGHRRASYYKLGMLMGLGVTELASLAPFLTAICQAEQLESSRVDQHPDRSPVVALGFDAGLSGHPSRWWYVYLGARYDFWTESSPPAPRADRLAAPARRVDGILSTIIDTRRRYCQIKTSKVDCYGITLTILSTPSRTGKMTSRTLTEQF